MTLPTLDQTEGIWIGRTNDQGYHYIQDVFSSDTSREHYHRTNCSMLIARGSLLPESHDGLAPAQRVWQKTQRYKQAFYI
jgi:hypothetical protein